MAIVYVPTSFWSVIFTTTGSVFFSLAVWLRALLFMLVAAAAQLCYDKQVISEEGWNLTSFVTWTSVLISFLMAFRLNFAYAKWEAASQAALDLSASSRIIMSRLIAYLEPNDANEEVLATVRRLLVLASVLIAKHVAADVDLKQEVEMGLLTAAELRAFAKDDDAQSPQLRRSGRGGALRIARQTSVGAQLQSANTPQQLADRHGKYFPTRGRPALVFCWLYKLVNSLLPHFPAGPDQLVSLEAELTAMSKIYERIEFLGLTIIPLSYCQLTRIASVIAVCVLPFDHQETWGYPTRCGLTFVFALIIIGVDAVAAEMETPFAGRVNDVDIKKIVRRTDRHTAALYSCWAHRAVTDFDVFPTTRRTERQKHWALNNRIIHRFAPSSGWEKTGGLSLYEITKNKKEVQEARVSQRRECAGRTARRASKSFREASISIGAVAALQRRSRRETETEPASSSNALDGASSPSSSRRTTIFEIEPGLLDRRVLEQQQPLAPPELSAPERASMLWLQLQQKASLSFAAKAFAASSVALPPPATPPAIEVQAVVKAPQPPPAEPGLRHEEEPEPEPEQEAEVVGERPRRHSIGVGESVSQEI